MTDLPVASPPRKLGLVIDLDTCVGCHACAVACKQWNTGGIKGPLTDENAYGREPFGVWLNRVHSYEIDDYRPQDSAGQPEAPSVEHRHSREGGNPVPLPSKSLGPRVRGDEDTRADGSRPRTPVPLTLHFPRSCLHCENAACVTVCPTGASYKRAADGIVLVDEDKCIGCKLCSWACPYGAREYSQVDGVMKKCTLCVDRIYNEHLDESERQPACVQACPTRARHFGDLADPESAVSKLVAERGGADLMPELGYRPTNKYLPPRARRTGRDSVASAEAAELLDTAALPPLLRWLDRVLSR